MTIMSKARSLAVVFLMDFLYLYCLSCLLKAVSHILVTGSHNRVETVQCYFLNLLILQPYLVTAFLWAFHCDHFRCFKVVHPVVWLIFHIMSCSVLPFADILSGCYSMPCLKLNFLSRLCQFWKSFSASSEGHDWKSKEHLLAGIHVYM